MPNFNLAAAPIRECVLVFCYNFPSWTIGRKLDEDAWEVVSPKDELPYPLEGLIVDPSGIRCWMELPETPA